MPVYKPVSHSSYSYYWCPVSDIVTVGTIFNFSSMMLFGKDSNLTPFWEHADMPITQMLLVLWKTRLHKEYTDDKVSFKSECILKNSNLSQIGAKEILQMKLYSS